MDRVIEKKTWTTKRILSIAGGLALVGLIGWSYKMTSGKSRLNVDTERITISEIKKGAFQETIPVNGTVLPQTTIYLDALEGGRVEEKYVEDGAMMKRNQPILRLSNTDLELSLANQETQVFNVLTQILVVPLIALLMPLFIASVVALFADLLVRRDGTDLRQQLDAL